MSNLSARLLASGIGIIDKLDRLKDPFEYFIRPCEPKGGVAPNLRDLEEVFDRDMRNFIIRGGTIYQYRLPTYGPLDLGDQSLWHGVYTFMWAVRNRVVPNPMDEWKVGLCLRGLEDQQPGGRLIRGIDEDGRVQEDASNDQATGHLLGLWGAWTYGNSPQRGYAQKLMAEWATNIYEHGHALVNPNGKPTTYGQLVQGWKTDPLRLTLCLAIYSTAYVMTGDSPYDSWVDDLLREYGSLLAYPKVRLWWMDTHYDSHRAAIHLMILAKNGPAPLAAHVGLDRLYVMLRKEANPWINALCTLGGRPSMLNYRVAKTVLSEMTLEDQMYNDPKINSTDPSIDKTVWNGQWVSRQPIPLWKRSADDFPWQRNRFALDQPRERDSRYNGGGYLAAYWLSRLTGILGPED